MQTAEIESIEVEQYEGPVYNLKTEHEEYIVNGIILHNCPHAWDTRPDQVSPENCEFLWLGGEQPRRRLSF